MINRPVKLGIILVLAILILSVNSMAIEINSGESGGETDFSENFEWVDEPEYPDGEYGLETTDPILVRGEILKVIKEDKQTDIFTNEPITNQTLQVRITSGDFKGKEIVAYNQGVNNPVYNIKVSKGDKVIIALELFKGEINQAYVADYLREPQVYTFAAFFVILLLAIGWRKGAKALCSLLITLILIWWILIPGLLKGYNPVLYTVAVATVATVVTMFTVGGFTWKSIAASLGTIAGVGLAGSLALIMGKAAHLTGFGTEEAAMLLYLPQNVQLDIQGLLFAGIIIGALGAVMDVSMSISSAIEEVKKANPDLETKDLIKAGLNVGRDIMGTMSNTLILAYTGSSIPLLIIFMAYQESFLKMINLDMIASEIVRALSGSIGMILVVPITAAIAGLLMKNNRPG